jgi:transcriptional regulator NrdR family protein
VSVTSVLHALNCPFCRSDLVRVIDTGSDDRAICPICFAAASYEETLSDIRALSRGSRIDIRTKCLVDRARFPAKAIGKGGKAEF